MIQGFNKPSAYFSTGDGIHRIEGEERQCVHCQFCWTYQPGSGTRRGICTRCNGPICGRPECFQQQKMLLAEFAHLSGSTDRHCIPWTDYVQRQREELAKRGWSLLPSGIIVSMR